MLDFLLALRKGKAMNKVDILLIVKYYTVIMMCGHNDLVWFGSFLKFNHAFMISVVQHLETIDLHFTKRL